MTAIEVSTARDFESGSVIPCVLSSVTAYALFGSVFGHEPIFGLQHFAAPTSCKLPFHAVLALLCLPVGAVYCKCSMAARPAVPPPALRATWCLRRRAPVGAMVLALPEVFGRLGYLQQAIGGGLSLQLMLTLVGLKILATTATISSAQRGVFGPTLLIGGMLGGAVGHARPRAVPAGDPGAGAFVLSAWRRCSRRSRTRRSARCDDHRDDRGYTWLPPLMLVSRSRSCSPALARLYENQLPSRFHSPAHLGNMMAHVLRRIAVRDALPRCPWCSPPARRWPGSRSVPAEHQLVFPVVDAQRRIVGTIALRGSRTGPRPAARALHDRRGPDHRLGRVSPGRQPVRRAAAHDGG